MGLGSVAGPFPPVAFVLSCDALQPTSLQLPAHKQLLQNYNMHLIINRTRPRVALSPNILLGIRNAQTHASHLNHAAIYDFERWVINNKEGIREKCEYALSKLMMYRERYMYDMKEK